MSGKAERLQDEGSKLQVVAAGATAGLVSRFVVAPLDVVKIRLQLQTHSLSDPLLAQRDVGGGPVYKGTLPTMRHILAHEGVAGLWKGNVPAELMYVCYSAVQFTTYRATTLLLQELQGTVPTAATTTTTTTTTTPRKPILSPAAESFVAGAAAGAAATAATYPLDLLRTRFAAQGSGPGERVYANMRAAVRTIARDEGVGGFFRGLAPALAQIAPFMGTFFAAYETLRGVRWPVPALLRGWGGGSGSGSGSGSGGGNGGDAAVAGVVAAVVAKTAVFPLDLVRKRIQVQGPTRHRYVHKNIPQYDGSVVRTLRTILAAEGVRGLYRGLTVSLFKAAPASAVTMWTYERVLHVLVRMEHKDE